MAVLPAAAEAEEAVEAGKYMRNISKLIISIAVCQLAGVIGTIFSVPAIKNWYSFLEKPSFSPPNWLFGPVWIILFFLMGISLFLVWKRGLNNNEYKNAIYAFALQLILNIQWSVIFFGLKSPGVAFLEILLLWSAILYAIIIFYRISKYAVFLLLPYIFWVSFAAVLNFFIWQLN